MTRKVSPEDDWRRSRPDAEHAIKALLSKIISHDDPLELFEAYAYSKVVTARAVRARMEMHLPEVNPTFRALHSKIEDQLHIRYGRVVPARFLKPPYGGKTHERLFSLLHEKLAQPVPAEMLRITTEDAVHTERRTRELRELGLDVHWYEEDGIDLYELRTLDLNFDMLPAIVRNKVRQTKSLTPDAKKQLLKNAGIPENG